MDTAQNNSNSIRVARILYTLSIALHGEPDLAEEQEDVETFFCKI